jgi:hypothetical protein
MKIDLARLGLAAVLGASLAGAAHAADEAKLKATLNGQNEKPAAADPKATGTAAVTIKGTQVCYELKTKDLAAPTMAHIHKAGPDAAGPVAVALTPPDANGMSKGCATADEAVAKDIAAHPGDYYVNVHSQEFKAGAIRGQLSGK